MVKITAHSGCDDTKDNSLEYLKYALNTEANAIEVDVRMNDKGDLVLGHDTGSDIELKEAFDLLSKHPDKKMNCDLKQRGLELVVYDLAKKCHVSSQLIYSGNVDLSKCLQQVGFEDVEVYMNIENVYPEIYESLLNGKRVNSLKDVMQRISEAGVHTVNLEYHLLEHEYTCDELAVLAENYQLNFSAWTVNNADDIQLIMNHKYVDNITTRSLKTTLEMRKELC